MTFPSQLLNYPKSLITLGDLSTNQQAIWIAVLAIVKLLLLGVTFFTIGSEQTVTLSLSLDLFFLTVGILYSRILGFTYLYTSILCMTLYLSYYFESGSWFTTGADDQIYYDNFLVLINSNGFFAGYDSLDRTDLTSALLALASAPFQVLGIQFNSPIDFFILQASCLAPLGPLIQKLSMTLYGKKISILYFYAFTPYWYFGVVGREWPLYYLALVITLLFLSNNRFIINMAFSFLGLYLASLVRFEAILIFGFFILFNIRNKMVFLAAVVLALMSMVSVSDYIMSLLDFATNKSRAIYFSQIEQSAGLGGALKYSENIFVKPIFIIYLIFSPIPPYFIHKPTIENFVLLFGHLFWPLLVFAFVFNWRKFIRIIVDSVGIRSAVVGFGTVILLMAFYGGTNRHYYPFVPHLLLILPLMFSIHKSFLFHLKRSMIILSCLGVFYIGIAVVL
jgi:hypothetical protein